MGGVRDWSLYRVTTKVCGALFKFFRSAVHCKVPSIIVLCLKFVSNYLLAFVFGKCVIAIYGVSCKRRVSNNYLCHPLTTCILLGLRNSVVRGWCTFVRKVNFNSCDIISTVLLSTVRFATAVPRMLSHRWGSCPSRGSISSSVRSRSDKC